MMPRGGFSTRKKRRWIEWVNFSFFRKFGQDSYRLRFETILLQKNLVFHHDREHLIRDIDFFHESFSLDPLHDIWVLVRE